MGVERARGRADLTSALVFVCVAAALACASYAPMIVAQKVVDLGTAYSLPKGFFVLNVLDNGILGANQTRSLTGGISYPKALVDTDFYLFNLTYNRTSSAPGGINPPTFDASRYFEVNLLSTKNTQFLQWNVYGYIDQVDLYPLQAGTAEPNALYAFELADAANKIYIVRWFMNSTLCVTTIRGGADFVMLPCQATNTAQQFQFIDAFSPNAPLPVPGQLLDVGGAYALPNGFFVSNVLDNKILGANQTWSLTGAVPYAKAVLNSEYYLFNLTFNRTGTSPGGNPPPSFDSAFFEINLLSTLPTTFVMWNVYEYKDQVDLYNRKYETPETNAQFQFVMVDTVLKVFVIMNRARPGECVSTTGGGIDYVMKPCQTGNTAQRFQLINPGNLQPPSSGGGSDFFSTAGGVIVILIIIGAAGGGAYAGFRLWKKRTAGGKHVAKSGTSDPALLTALDPTGTDHDTEAGSYRKIGDNMELGNATGNGNGKSKRGASPADDY